MLSLQLLYSLNNTEYHMHCMLDTPEDIFMHLKCFKIGNYCITFILHCLPKSEYLTVICCYHYYVMFTFPTRIFYRGVPGLQLIVIAAFVAVD